MSKRAICYARVSTDEQAEKGYSLPSQLEACQLYAQQNGFTVTAEITDDYTGTTLDRPGFNHLWDMFTQRKADVLIVYTSDRLARSLIDLLTLQDELEAMQVELHFVNRGRVGHTPETRMVNSVEGSFNEYWREKIIEGMKRGKLSKAKAGKWIGGIPAPYGYRGVGEKESSRLEIDPETAEIVKRIFTWYTLGEEPGKPLTVHAIARRLDQLEVPRPGGRRGPGMQWYPATIWSILKNTVYIGVWQYKNMVPVEVEGFLPLDLFEAAQQRIQLNRRLSHARPKRVYLLRGRLRCFCGRSLVGDRDSKKNYRFYRCSSAGLWHAEAHSVSISAEFAEASAWDWIARLLGDPENRRRSLREMQSAALNQSKPLRKRLEQVNKLIAKNKADADALVSQFLDNRPQGLPEVLQAAIVRKAEDIQKLIASLEEERARIQHNLRGTIVTDEDIDLVDSLFQSITQAIQDDYDYGLQQATEEDKQKIINLLDLRGDVIGETSQDRHIVFTCQRPGINLLNASRYFFDFYLKY
ncbi:MAG: recombinase family protein [Anaerolineales bacterium]|nr:recombinase family protein [Anaerolineales bacterium]